MIPPAILSVVTQGLMGMGSQVGQSGSGASASPGGGGSLLKGVTNPATAAITGGLAAAKFISGKIKQKKADAMLPRYEDPEERALASYATRRKRAFQTGTASASTRNALAQAMKTGINKSFQVGGGAKGLNALTQAFNSSQLGVQNQDLAGEMGYAQMESEAKKRISQRKLELGLLKYNTMQARAAQQLKEAKGIGMATLARSMNIDPGSLNPYGMGGQLDTGYVTATNEE